jgi:hypothetical protein
MPRLDTKVARRKSALYFKLTRNKDAEPSRGLRMPALSPKRAETPGRRELRRNRRGRASWLPRVLRTRTRAAPPPSRTLDSHEQGDSAPSLNRIEFQFRAPALKRFSWRLDLKDSRPNCLALVFCICKFNRI